jgi:RNA polymerase sigma factor (sigma-70 family)
LASSEESRTSLSLLQALNARSRPEREAAWEQVVKRYGPRIFTWCQQRRLQEPDAADVTQEVLKRLFQYGGSVIRKYNPEKGGFRAWLKKTTINAINSYLKENQQKWAGAGGSAVLEVLKQAQAPKDLAKELEEAFDLELREVAEERVRQRVEGHVWEAYWQVAKEGKPASEVAHQVGVPISNLYVYQGRVVKMLQEEIRQLEEESNQGMDRASPQGKEDT